MSNWVNDYEFKLVFRDGDEAEMVIKWSFPFPLPISGVLFFIYINGVYMRMLMCTYVSLEYQSSRKLY